MRPRRPPATRERRRSPPHQCRRPAEPRSPEPVLCFLSLNFIVFCQLMPQTRRDFGKLALAAIPAACALIAAPELPSVFNGVRLGIGSYSIREYKLDDIIAALPQVPLGTQELAARYDEPGMMTAERGG